ncbi:AAA family ATPase [Microbacterium sp. H1-D42]|uniref:AAA family ATPase n=1 Tax=Microbacterium sp. H1-D42 TaxID=2925844 RepID=UPI001F538A44|nr:AAA family ATPase [Microbacterium sp. H1-D42]UNK71083.1 AAA family ATPase [Microbacterium sp. H1-D42]
MLLSVTGASGVGKSTALGALRKVDFGRPMICVEFDSIGVPEGADTAWRHDAIERWVQFALAAQDEGSDVMLFGQAPPGELLAAPSADQLDGIAICVLHASPTSQEARLLGRGEPADSLVHHLRFGTWFHEHARNPQHAPEVIRVETPTPMAWDRWMTLTPDDSDWVTRWPVTVIATDDLTAEQVAAEVEEWARGVQNGQGPGIRLRGKPKK